MLAIPQLLEFSGAQIDVADDASECPDLQVRIAVHGNRGVLVTALKEMVAAANTNDGEAFFSRKRIISFPVGRGELSHGRTQRDRVGHAGHCGATTDAAARTGGPPGMLPSATIPGSYRPTKEGPLVEPGCRAAI